MKHTLILRQSGPFASNPRFAELEDSEVLCNNVVLPEEFNPHNVRLWVIGNEYGALCALWADCEQYALDTLIDEGKGNSFLVPEDEVKAARLTAEDDCPEEWTSLGNAGELCDLTHAWIAPVEFEPARDWKLLCRFAEARGQGSDTLYF